MARLFSLVNLSSSFQASLKFNNAEFADCTTQMAVNQVKEHGQVGQVTWRAQSHPSQPHPPPEFLLPVHPLAYREWLSDHSAVPLVDVVDTFEVFVNRTGSRSGHLDRPSKQQLQEAFGSDDMGKVVERLLERGEFRPLPHGNEMMPMDRRSFMYRRD